jgi:hypothetical protein
MMGPRHVVSCFPLKRARPVRWSRVLALRCVVLVRFSWSYAFVTCSGYHTACTARSLVWQCGRCCQAGKQLWGMEARHICSGWLDVQAATEDQARLM